jgi:hypothetical protein
MTLQGLCLLEFFLVPVSSVYVWDSAELWLAAQCLRWVSVMGLHEGGGFGLTCTLEEKGARFYHVFCTQLQRQFVADGWHKIFTALSAFSSNFLLPSSSWVIK